MSDFEQHFDYDGPDEAWNMDCGLGDPSDPDFGSGDSDSVLVTINQERDTAGASSVNRNDVIRAALGMSTHIVTKSTVANGRPSSATDARGNERSVEFIA